MRLTKLYNCMMMEMCMFGMCMMMHARNGSSPCSLSV